MRVFQNPLIKGAPTRKKKEMKYGCITGTRRACVFASTCDQGVSLVSFLLMDPASSARVHSWV